MAFPEITQGKVSSLVISALSQNGTFLTYKKVSAEEEFYKLNAGAFQKAFSVRYKNSLNAKGISPSVTYETTGGNCLPGDENCYNNIEEVIITVAVPLQPGSDTKLYLPPIGAGDPGVIGGDCTAFGGCNDGGGGDNTEPEQDPCEKATAENTEAKSLLEKADVKSQKEKMVESIKTDKNEKGFSFGKDKNGNYKTTDIKTGTDENSVSISATNTDITVEGGAHTHTPSLYDCFSAGDFYALHGANSANSNFKYYYVFSEDAGYVITITNPEKFKKFTENFPMNDYFDKTTGDWKKDTSIYNTFDNAYQQFLRSGKDEDLAFEYATVMVMSKYDMGISLSKQDSSGNFGSVFVKENQIPIQVAPGVFVPISTFEKTDDCNLK